LFVAEAVTLAHVGRPLALARTLDRQRYEVHFACAPGYEQFFSTPLRHWPLTSISSARFLAALAAGKPVYDARTLHQYVLDDMRLLQAVRPDVVIGDFRLSLSVSARLAEVPYVALANAYWSPYVHQHYQVPARRCRACCRLRWRTGCSGWCGRWRLPCTAGRSTACGGRIDAVAGLRFAAHLHRCRPRAVCRYPGNVPGARPAATHSYLGPVTWSPPMDPPSWWDALPGGRDLIYVTLGSSGQGACCRACCRRWRRCR
jgi:UDP:flavonoid glycosyltransferase YjiC (YdhE family)